MDETPEWVDEVKDVEIKYSHKEEGNCLGDVLLYDEVSYTPR